MRPQRAHPFSMSKCMQYLLEDAPEEVLAAVETIDTVNDELVLNVNGECIRVSYAPTAFARSSNSKSVFAIYYNDNVSLYAEPNGVWNAVLKVHHYRKEGQPQWDILAETPHEA